LRALVTGAAGFAGSHLVELLLARGVAVHGLVFPGGSVANLAAVQDDPRLTLVEADLRDPDRIRGAIETALPEHIYHLAAESSVGQSLHDPRPAFRTNTFGTLHVLEAVRRAGLTARVLIVSSAEVYGESADRNHRIQETEPMRPLTPYGASKAAAEVIARRYAQEWGLTVVRARPFTHTGPRHDPRFAFSDWARQLVEIDAGRQAPRLRVGNLNVCRDISDVRDVVSGYIQLVAHGQAGAVYNLCSGRGYLLHDVLDQLIRLTGLQVTVERGADRLRAQDIPALIGSPEAARATIGWEATIPLSRTLADLVAYWRQQPTP
jgi:GDP-4-dehydro-6-deoxy-D-mannose reductase